MCQEIYHMMRTMNQDGLEFQLALQCAPLITGIKISNLLMVCGKREDAVQELLWFRHFLLLCDELAEEDRLPSVS